MNPGTVDRPPTRVPADRLETGSSPDRPTGGADPAPASEGQAPGLLLRLAVMTYEAVLLFGVVFVAGYALLAAAGWSHPLQPAQRAVLQAVLVVVIGAYFVYSWVRSGQTLPMKSWRLRVVDRGGGLLSPGRAALRYLLAWSLFAPGLLVLWLAGIHGLPSLLVLLASLLAMLAVARLNRRRQLLHDLILGSRVIRE